MSHSRAGGFVLTVEKYSRFRSFVSSTAGVLCIVTRHRWCNSGVISWGLNQDWTHAETLAEIPIDRETADKLSEKNTWDWLDNVEDET